MSPNRLYQAFGMVCVIMGGIAFGFFEYVILEPGGTVTDNDDTITHRFWIGGDDVEFDIRVGDFEGLGSSVSRSMAFPAVAYKFITPDNPTMIRLYDALNERMVGMDDKERANFLMAFVESNIEYCEDIDSHGKSEWVQYPIETILLGEGDCED